MPKIQNTTPKKRKLNMSTSERTSSSNTSYTMLMKECRHLYRSGKRKYSDGEFSSALSEFEKAVSMQERLYGKYHFDTVKSYWWKGMAACKTSNENLALKSFQRAMRMGESAFDGPSYEIMLKEIDKCWRDSHTTGDILSEMKQIFECEGEGDKAFKERNFTKAIEFYYKSLKLQDELVGSDSLDGADIRCKLAVSLLRTSAEIEAHQALTLAYDCYVNQVGVDHPATLGAAATMKNLTSVGA